MNEKEEEEKTRIEAEIEAEGLASQQAWEAEQYARELEKAMQQEYEELKTDN